MVWIKDIWVYFLNEDDIDRAYIEYGTGEIVFSCSENSIPIPRVFTRVGLLREYINNSDDRKLIKISAALSDEELRKLYHSKYSYNYELDNAYSQWVPYAKNVIFDYVEEWCLLNNFKCSKKEDNKFGKYVYLDCL